FLLLSSSRHVTTLDLPSFPTRRSSDLWKYHNTSKHSYASVHNNPHFLDWSNQPLPFKAYTTLEPLRLPREVRQTGVAALSAIAEDRKSTRLNSSHGSISYAVFCLKKKI